MAGDDPRPPLGGRLLQPASWLPLALVVGLAVLIVVVGSPAKTQGAARPGSTPAARRHAPTSSPSAPPRPALRMLFVGASVDRGMFASSMDHSYPMLVANSLEQGGQQVTWSLDARTGASVADGLSWSFPAGQDVIVVHLVTNDYSNDNTPLPVYRSEFSQLLDKLRESSPAARLICLGAWEAPHARNSVGETVTDFDLSVRSACQARGGTFVPLSAIFDQPINRGPIGALTAYGTADNYHPNDAGQQAIANTVLAAIRTGRSNQPEVAASATVPRPAIASAPAPTAHPRVYPAYRRR
ncbi:MAG: GDSL-type esterase/lipase family protein [Candidatus Dormiibacterota bacterium]